jgi:hypothetical protein
MAAVDPDQEAALRRLRAAFGFVEVLRIVDHDDDQDQDDDEEAIEEGEPLPPAGPVVSARRRRATAVHDSLALVRVGPQQLVGGRPAGMLGRGVPLQVPGAEEPAAAALDRAAPLRPGQAWVVEAEQGVRLGKADLQARDADQHREQALDLTEGAGEGPAEGTVRPHRTPMLELVFEKR